MPERRDVGSKTILGETGHFELDDVIAIVSRQTALAGFLAGKLADYFGTVTPPVELRVRMATTFQETRGDIREVLRVLFVSPEFASEASRGSLIKSPVRLLVGACRQLKLDVTATPSLAQLPAAMGKELFNPPNVKGWPGGRTWIAQGPLPSAITCPKHSSTVDQRPGAARLQPIPQSRHLKQGPAMVARLEGAMAQRSSERKQDGLKCRFRAEALYPQGPPASRRPWSTTCSADSWSPRSARQPATPWSRPARTRPEDRPNIAARLILTSPEYQMA